MSYVRQFTCLGGDVSTYSRSVSLGSRNQLIDFFFVIQLSDVYIRNIQYEVFITDFRSLMFFSFVFSSIRTKDQN